MPAAKNPSDDKLADVNKRFAAIRALRDGATTPSEREAAQAALDRLLDKYGEEITEDEPIVKVEFTYKNNEQHRLIAYMAAKVTNNSHLDYWHCVDKRGRKTRRVYFKLPADQAAELEATVDLLLSLWEQAQKDLFTAFIYKHDLFTDEDKENKGKGPVNMDRLCRLQAMMGGLIASRKQLPSG